MNADTVNKLTGYIILTQPTARMVAHRFHVSLKTARIWLIELANASPIVEVNGQPAVLANTLEPEWRWTFTSDPARITAHNDRYGTRHSVTRLRNFSQRFSSAAQIGIPYGNMPAAIPYSGAGALQEAAGR